MTKYPPVTVVAVASAAVRVLTGLFDGGFHDEILFAPSGSMFELPVPGAKDKCAISKPDEPTKTENVVEKAATLFL